MKNFLIILASVFFIGCVNNSKIQLNEDLLKQYENFENIKKKYGGISNTSGSDKEIKDSQVPKILIQGEGFQFVYKLNYETSNYDFFDVQTSNKKIFFSNHKIIGQSRSYIESVFGPAESIQNFGKENEDELLIYKIQSSHDYIVLVLKIKKGIVTWFSFGYEE